MQQFVFALIVGLGAGGMYAILASGLVVGFKGSGVINFAQGAIAMYTAYTWSELRLTGNIKLPWFDILPTETLNLPVTLHVAQAPVNGVLAFIIAMGMAAFIGLLCHLLVFRPLRNSPPLNKVVGSVGILLYLQQVAVINFGTTNRSERGFLPQGSWRNFLNLSADLGKDRMYVAIIAVIVGVVLTLLYRYTRFGLATRAADENEKGAILLGLSPQLIAGINWVLSAMLAGLAGLLFVGISTLNPVNYALFVVPALTAALLGNLTSIAVATAAGLALGAIQSGVTDLATRTWWPDWLPKDATTQMIPFIVVVVFLYVRGNQLPVRGSVAQARQTRVPEIKHKWVAPGVTFALGLIGLIWLSGAWQVALTTSLLFATFMLSLVVIVGFVGQISLAQLSIAGVAAFAYVRLVSNGTKVNEFADVIVKGPGWPAPLAMAVAVVIAIMVGMLVGLPALRIRGVQLAVVTITAAIAIEVALFRNESVVGPGAKSNNPVPRPYFFGIDVGIFNTKSQLPDRWQFALFLLLWLVVLMLLVTNLRSSDTGRRFLAVRANERAAAATGINVARTKLLGFAISSGIAGISGVLLAFKLTQFKYDNFDLFYGLGLLAFAFLGGITVASGAAVGGFLVGGGLMAAFLSDHFHGVEVYIVAVGAIGLIVTAIFNPEGIVLANVELGRMIGHKFRKKAPPDAAGPPPLPTAAAEPQATAGT